MQVEYVHLLHQKDSDAHKVSLQNAKHSFKSIFPIEVIYVDHSPNFKNTLFKQMYENKQMIPFHLQKFC